MTAPNPMDDEILRNEIQAAIKAGRELNPEMDQHLADSALNRYREEAKARQRQMQAPPPAPPASTSSWGREASHVVVPFIGLAVCLTLFAALVFTPFGWHFWWLIFFLPGMFWWGGGRRRWRNYDRRQRFEDRWYHNDPRYLGPGSDPNPNQPHQPISMV